MKITDEMVGVALLAFDQKGGYSKIEKMRAALEAALSAQPQTVAVKPLEWKRTHEEIEHASFMGVVYYARGDGRWGHTLEIKQNQSGQSLEEAKAAAQADCIRSVLTTAPADKPQTDIKMPEDY